MAIRKRYLIISILIVAALGLLGYFLWSNSSPVATNLLNNHSQTSSLKTWDDGTAYVRGQVEERILDCAFDGACYLKLLVNNQEVRIIYTAGDSPCLNSDPANHAQEFNKGSWVKAFGAYNQVGKFHTIYTCDSTDYFIRGINEGTPAGPVTERFFDEAIERKAEQHSQQPPVGSLSAILTSGSWIKTLGTDWSAESFTYTFLKDGSYTNTYSSDYQSTSQGTWKLSEAADGKAQLFLTSNGSQCYWLPCHSIVEYDSANDKLIVSGPTIVGQPMLERSK